MQRFISRECLHYSFIVLTTVLCPKEIRDNNTIVIYEKTFDTLGPVWDLRNTVPVFLALLIFPFLNFNSTTFFTKFNSLGEYIYMLIQEKSQLDPTRVTVRKV